MHHDPSGPPSRAGHRAASARSSSRPPRRLRQALTVSGVLALVAATAVAVLGLSGPGSTGPRKVDAATAAARKTLPVAAPAAPAAGTGTAGTGRAQQGGGPAAAARQGDHRRQAPQPADPAAAPDPNCTLSVPVAPTSAAGLATPYRLTATDPGAGACHEANTDQSAFVEAAVYNPATHGLAVYHPLVVDGNQAPAIPPVPVRLPAGAVVGVWFGFNGDTLTLTGPGARSCVNGLPGSPFGQFAYCNAPAFFAAVNADTKVTIPALGTGTDGLPCPTTRDFSVVDQDQSDNLATVYRVLRGRMAQDTTAAQRGTKLTNGSDEGLLAKAIDPALGCTPFEAPDLGNHGAMTPALALNELSAARNQAAPAALVPTSDPMVQVNGRTSDRKTDLYRAGVDQPSLATDPGQSPAEYCAALAQQTPSRLATDRTLFRGAPAPAAGATSLLAFLQDRYQTTLVNLNCRAAAKAAARGAKAAAPNGAAPNGAAPNGAAPNGAAPNAAAPNAAGPATTPAAGATTAAAGASTDAAGASTDAAGAGTSTAPAPTAAPASASSTPADTSTPATGTQGTTP